MVDIKELGVEKPETINYLDYKSYSSGKEVNQRSFTYSFRDWFTKFLSQIESLFLGIYIFGLENLCCIFSFCEDVVEFSLKRVRRRHKK